MLRTDDRRLIRIPIKTICYQGWSAIIDGHFIELDHLPDGIAITTDGFRHPIRFRVYEQVIKNLRLENGGYCPPDRRFIYYVYGRDGRRYKALYILDGTNIGTRADLGLRYPCQTRSHRQRKYWKAGYRVRFKPHRLKRLIARDQAQQERRNRERQGMTAD
jgi:hypothetical protein